ncbi:MAG: hypothetical protein KJ749_01075 [Planctomycetes bacterium]|nr:hypothetical protein [Planctomycetota bacterium]
MTANSPSAGMMYGMITVSGCNLKAACFAARRPRTVGYRILPGLKDRGDSGTKIAQGSRGVCTDLSELDRSV